MNPDSSVFTLARQHVIDFEPCMAETNRPQHACAGRIEGRSNGSE